MYKALIVDDEPLVRRYMKEHIPALDPRWNEVDTAGDGSCALDLLKQNKYDLIITDIKMPGMDGLTLCEHIRKTSPEQRIAILSGYDEFSFAKQALHYNVQEYLIKPVIQEELASLLDKAAKGIRRQADRQAEEQKQQALLAHSLAHMSASFLRAVVDDLAVEVKNLYPILGDHGIRFIPEQGAVMLLDIDEDSMLLTNIKIGESPVYRHMLNRMAGELDGPYAFVDREERCCLLIPGRDAIQINETAEKIYARLSKEFFNHTGISLSGAIGDTIANVFAIKESHTKADALLDTRLKHGNGFFITQTESDKQYLARVKNAVTSIQSAVLDSDRVACRMAVDQFVRLFPAGDTGAMYRHGLYLAKELGWLYPASSEVLLNEAADLMQSRMEGNCAGIMERIACMPMGGDRCADSEYDLIRRVQDFIRENYHRAIGLDDVAESVHVSASYLSSHFHKAVGESYIQYLTRIRINEAAKLLRTNPQANVSDIAKNVGYISPKHFSHVFKKHFTMPPGEYQRKYGNLPNLK